MSASVVVFDYGSGNVRSAVRALERVGASVTLTARADEALAADGLVVPGVGNFHACMAGLRAPAIAAGVSDAAFSQYAAGVVPDMGVRVSFLSAAPKPQAAPRPGVPAGRSCSTPHPPRSCPTTCSASSTCSS